MALDILVVDDEADIRELVAGVMEDEGYAARTAGNADEALAALDERRPSLVLLDVWLEGSRMDGLELLDAIKERDPTIPVLVFSGHGTLDTAVAAIRRGAVDFLEKPFEADRLLYLVGRVTETERLRAENRVLKAQASLADEIHGVSPAINNVRATLKRVASTGSRVLISGPAGVGKEVAARLLHNWSGRANAPFVVLAAASMEPDTIEAELFGVERDGQVTPGLLERAHGGTLFIDEVSDMPLTTQAKILRVLTEQSFTRLGGSRLVRVDVRIVSATSRDLTVEIEEKRFREDLYYRLNVVPVVIPPLRERRADIPVLAEHFLDRLAAERRVPVPRLSDDALATLQGASWPGNVRQLRNVIERVMILAPQSRLDTIEVDMLPNEVVHGEVSNDDGGTALMMGAPLREAREAFEREYLRVQIRRFAGNVSRTAAFVGMERSALHRKLKLLGLTEDRGG